MSIFSALKAFERRIKLPPKSSCSRQSGIT